MHFANRNSFALYPRREVCLIAPRPLMQTTDDVQELLAHTIEDGMVVRWVRLPPPEVAYFKSLIESHQGLAFVLAPRRPAHQAPTNLSAVAVVSTPAQKTELDELLVDLREELALHLDDVA